MRWPLPTASEIGDPSLSPGSGALSFCNFDFQLPKAAFSCVTITHKIFATMCIIVIYITYLYSPKMSYKADVIFFVWQLRSLLTLQRVELIINRTEIYTDNMHGHSIIWEDSRLNCSSWCTWNIWFLKLIAKIMWFVYWKNILGTKNYYF